MKKAIWVILIFYLCLSLTSCSNSTDKLSIPEVTASVSGLSPEMTTIPAQNEHNMNEAFTLNESMGGRKTIAECTDENGVIDTDKFIKSYGLKAIDNAGHPIYATTKSGVECYIELGYEGMGMEVALDESMSYGVITGNGEYTRNNGGNVVTLKYAKQVYNRELFDGQIVECSEATILALELCLQWLVDETVSVSSNPFEGKGLKYSIFWYKEKTVLNIPDKNAPVNLYNLSGIIRCMQIGTDGEILSDTTN